MDIALFELQVYLIQISIHLHPNPRRLKSESRLTDLASDIRNLSGSRLGLPFKVVSLPRYLSIKILKTDS